jgi:ASC-1-like (ASCH) protein
MERVMHTTNDRKKARTRSRRSGVPRQRTHVALVKASLARLILTGEKRVEARLSINRRAPFGRVARGDLVYFKIVGGPIAARARVAAVRTWSDLDAHGVARLAGAFESLVRGGDAFWERKARARHATLIWLDDVEAVSEGPVLLRRPGCRNAWHEVGTPRRAGRAA